MKKGVKEKLFGKPTTECGRVARPTRFALSIGASNRMLDKNMAAHINVRSVNELRAKYRHLAWSNPDAAEDDVYVAAALRRANFFELLDFAAVLGADRLRAVWDVIQTREPERVRAVAGQIDRIFRHLSPAAEECRA